MAHYLTIAADGEAETEVRRSRFRCTLRRVGTEDEARAVVDGLRREHWDARHHCSAFVLGAPPQQVERSHDDGEPAGTAGTPMLEVLRGAGPAHEGVSDVVAVVTRWFGGTLLGAGGLVRAYTAAAQAGLAEAGRLRREPRTLVEVAVPAAQAGRLENAIRQAGADVGEVRWADQVVLPVTVPDPAAFARLVAEQSGGAARVTEVGQVWADVPDVR